MRTMLMSAAVMLPAMITLSAGEAWAQTTVLASAETISAEAEAAPKRAETVVVTGARGKPRAILDSAVPVDVIGEEAIGAVSFVDTNDVIRTLVPSFSLSRQPISDGATFTRPATLRGLPSDKTLVLVNSKRRHRAALVGIGGSGTQGPDLATIPATAIGSVEVLRDGAAAQYGSDAIAGVFNFLLRENSEGFEIAAQAGQYYEGDGEEWTVNGNIGLPLTDKGFVNISFEGSANQPTNRAVQYELFNFAAYLAANPSIPANVFKNPANPWGQPKGEAARVFVNAGIDLTETTRVYAFGNWSGSEGESNFFYRPPNNPINAPLIRLANGQPFRFAEIFPGGFLPIFGAKITDYSLVGGLKGELGNGLAYDLYARYGRNKVSYSLRDTVNPSLGQTSPREFRPGDLISDELGIGAEFSYEFELGWTSPLTLAFGAEWRDEGYEIVLGEPDSYRAGPFARQDPFDFCSNETNIALRNPTVAGAGIVGLNCRSATDPVYTVLPVGSNGFPGFGPDAAGSLNRDSYGFYVDASADITDKFFLNAAVRYENYSDFGDTVDGKLSARYKITEAIALRGSVGTGFRAPTPGQLFTTNVSTRIDADGFPVASGLFPATNPVSVFLGAKPLQPEKSVNLSAGITATLFEMVDVTLDIYQIELSDQFYAATPIAVTPALRAALIAANIPGGNTIGQVQFFQNSFDSTTQGVDLVATYVHDWEAYGQTSFVFGVNYNTYSIDRLFNPTLFNREGIYDFENDTPNIKGNLSATHTVGNWTFLGRANFWGPYSNSNLFTNGTFTIQDFDTEVFFDAEVSYQFNDNYRLTLGARNLFDGYPQPGDPALAETTAGRIYRSDSVVDWQGGFYYLKASAKF